MKIKITADEFRQEYVSVFGKDPSDQMIQYALEYNEALNNREGTA